MYHVQHNLHFCVHLWYHQNWYQPLWHIHQDRLQVKGDPSVIQFIQPFLRRQPKLGQPEFYQPSVSIRFNPASRTHHCLPQLPNLLSQLHQLWLQSHQSSMGMFSHLIFLCKPQPVYIRLQVMWPALLSPERLWVSHKSLVLSVYLAEHTVKCWCWCHTPLEQTSTLMFQLPHHLSFNPMSWLHRLSSLEDLPGPVVQSCSNSTPAKMSTRYQQVPIYMSTEFLLLQLIRLLRMAVQTGQIALIKAIQPRLRIFMLRSSFLWTLMRWLMTHPISMKLLSTIW